MSYRPLDVGGFGTVGSGIARKPNSSLFFIHFVTFFLIL
jgi:hypothetical protein